MDIAGFWYMLSVFIIFHSLAFATFFTITDSKVKKVSDYMFDLLMELVFELGKALMTTSIMGKFFIKENEKDFTFGLIGGIIFFISGYAFKRKKEKK